MSHRQIDGGGPGGFRAIKVKIERWRGKREVVKEQSLELQGRAGYTPHELNTDTSFPVSAAADVVRMVFLSSS